MSSADRVIVVFGATGRQGGAVVRHLRQAGWHVRAATRDPQGAKARALAGTGVEVMQADFDQPKSLEPLLKGAWGVYSMQTPYPKGAEAEVRQGKQVADAARAAGIGHVVYGSAGVGIDRTGVPSWESKVAIETYMRSIGLPLTVLQPAAFMELMTDAGYYPAMTTWHVMPNLVGAARPIPWLCTDDMGAIAARVFSDSNQYVGQRLLLASDFCSVDACRTAYRAAFGKAPSRLPMPPWLFERFGFIGQDLCRMWRWLGAATYTPDQETARALLPTAHTVESWLKDRASQSPSTASTGG